ncbi:hypothetical protein [Mitsuokella multacida]|uniref:hypothetical protein n=1 Tax=Mitsuokella multacida TaxID=52226 RepID=UPI00267314B3|nr:hypothetical protein [Mitsuokella multacida]
MEITIHRALSQLKTTQARIEDKFEKDIYVSSTIGKTNMAEGRPVDAVKREILANFDSMQQLLKNYQTLKLAIIRSNSGITEESTNIKTGMVEGMELTVAEAIAIQKYVLPLESQFVRRLENQLNNAKRTIEMTNSQANTEITSVLEALSNKDSKNLDPSQVNTITEAYQQNKFRQLVDPLDLADKIRKLRDKLDALSVGVDAFLSESNAISHINVDLG